MLFIFCTISLLIIVSKPAIASEFFNPHGNYDINTSGCGVCHSSHFSIGSRLLTNTKERKLCYSCHDGSGSMLDVKTAFGDDDKGSSTLMSYHPVPSGVMACTDCHGPHLTPGEKPGILSAGDLGLFSGNAVCGVCHGTDSLLPSGDIVTSITGTPHDSGLSGPTSGTEIKCIRCHQPHGSSFDTLLEETIYNEKGISRSITGSNNTVCFACHAEGLRTYNGESDFTQVKHGSPNTSTKASSVYPGTSYSPGMCLNCHEPHGKTGYSNYKRGEGNTLCVNCHDVPPVDYSYRGITAYNNTPHSTITGPTGASELYTPLSQDFTVWQGLQNQTPTNPGQLVVSSVSSLHTQDSSYLITDLAVLQDDFNTQMYRFKVTDYLVSYSKISIKWIGYGEPTVNHPTQLSIWNKTLNSGLGNWELLQSKQLGTEGVLEVARDNPTEYVNAEGEIYLLAGAMHDGTAPGMSSIQEKMIKATAPYTVQVTWNTNEPAKTWIDYGTTTDYGTTLSNATFKTSHTFDIPGLEKNIDYYYRIRSEDPLKNQSAVARSFKLIDPPIPPTLVDHGDINIGSVILKWNKTANANVQYQVQVSTSSAFSSIYSQSAWLNDNGLTLQSWSTEIGYVGTIYWRVKARYASHPVFESVSAIDTFLSNSCPILYTWNGEKFEYVTDLVAGANLGLELAPGKYLNPDPDDQVAIPGSLLVEKNGVYTLKVKNELNEIDYIDSLVLQAVDHPVGTKIALNDFVRHKEPYKVYTYSEYIRPVEAATYINNPTYSGSVPSESVDITELVSKIDNRHAIGALGDDNQFTFDLGDIKNAAEVKLVVVGWTKFNNEAERAERVEKSAQGIKRAADLVEILQPDGTWKSEEIKHILGHTKTAVIDLTGMFAEGSEEFIVRLRGLYRPHLDFVGVDTTVQAPITVTDLELVKSRLEYGGMAERKIYPSPDYDYYKILDIVKQHKGRFTRYGDVLPLLAEIDDKLIVMDSGDELTVNYKAIPPPQTGMTRSFVLKPYAYYKELDAAVVEPMPFRDMDLSQFPESLGEYPDELKQYVEEWNTRIHPTEQFDLQHEGFLSSFKQLISRLQDWFYNRLENQSKIGINSNTQFTGQKEFLSQSVGELHYSLNANYLELVIEGTITAGAAGECVNCHAVHGNSGVPKQLISKVPPLCFGNGAGCHSEAENSASRTISSANFTSATGATSRHSIVPEEQALFGTQVGCMNCHNPHLNDAQNKTVDPDNTLVFLNQWVDKGIGNYISNDGSVHLLAKAKHDGTPPAISQINHAIDNAVYTTTVSWKTNEVSTRQLEWIVTPLGYPDTVPDAVYNDVYTAGDSTTFYSPSSTHSLKITGMEQDLEYRYRIRAEDRVGNVSYSSAGAFDRIVRLASPPSAPTNLSYSPNPLPSGQQTENVRLEWEAAVDPQGYEMQYYVHLSSPLSVALSGWLPVGQTYWNTSVSNYDTVQYSWKVMAKNVYGTEGPYSDTASFTHIGETIVESCPVLYTWDGEEYRFINDIVAGSNIGLQVGVGKYLQPSPDEQVVIPGDLLVEKDGFLTIKIKNELDEIDYIDNLQLFAVNHPVGTQIALNDFVRSREPFTVYTYSEKLVPVKKATYINNPTYSGGEPTLPVDITELVSQIDNRHAIGSLGDDNQFILELGDLQRAQEIKLVIKGWTEFMDAEERVERVEKSKQGIKRAADLVEVLQPDGTWLSEEIKHIPGHSKTAVIDLNGKFAAGTTNYVVRLRGLYRPHLDFIGVDTSTSQQWKETSLELVHASLEYGGLAQRKNYPSPDYNYNEQMSIEIQHEGRFTRYGDVLPLLKEVDDKLIVMDTGDELTVNFKAMPPPAPGMTRSYVLRPWAYYKELSAATVEPMPFRDMDFSRYPQSLGKYPKELQQYVKEWNTRIHQSSKPSSEKSFIRRLMAFLQRTLQWKKGFFDGGDTSKEGVIESTKARLITMPTDRRGEVPSAIVDEESPEHYSLNSNFARVSVTTAAGNVSYYPNSLDSDAWESNVMPTFSSPGMPATETQKNNASTEGSSVWSTNLAGAEEFNYQLFKFTIQEPISSINKLSVRWTGYGEPTPGYDTTFYIWNASTQSWQQLASGLYYQPTTFDLFRNKDNSAYCNKCHDNNPPAGVFMGAKLPANIATSMVNDYHGDYMGNKATLLPPYVRNSSRLACDDCHDPHGNNNVYHIRDQVNLVGGISLTKTNGLGGKALCQTCHTGDFTNNWHASCVSCHVELAYGDHYNTPAISESLLKDCFRCHGHNRKFTDDPGCEGCHGPFHSYDKAF